jgi:riboflavin kinase/FMN adenylyltransferase
MEVVSRVEGLRPELGPAFVVIGVFDGLHLGHQYLLRHLVAEADARRAHPTVITFDHHPDEVLTGHAPPLLLDQTERLDRLEAAGVEVTVVQPFDAALRETPYNVFVERIRDRIELRGFLMTPEAAFGYERKGTPETLAAMGRTNGFDVVLIEPFTLEGRSVRSADIRSAIASGELAQATALLGRPVTLTGVIRPHGPLGRRVDFDLPMALPPDGDYRGELQGQPIELRVEAGVVYLLGQGPGMERATIELSVPAATAAR